MDMCTLYVFLLHDAFCSGFIAGSNYNAVCVYQPQCVGSLSMFVYAKNVHHNLPAGEKCTKANDDDQFIAEQKNW